MGIERETEIVILKNPAVTVIHCIDIVDVALVEVVDLAVSLLFLFLCSLLCLHSFKLQLTSPPHSSILFDLPHFPTLFPFSQTFSAPPSNAFM